MCLKEALQEIICILTNHGLIGIRFRAVGKSYASRLIKPQHVCRFRPGIRIDRRRFTIVIDLARSIFRQQGQSARTSWSTRQPNYKGNGTLLNLFHGSTTFFKHPKKVVFVFSIGIIFTSGHFKVSTQRFTRGITKIIIILRHNVTGKFGMIIRKDVHAIFTLFMVDMFLFLHFIIFFLWLWMTASTRCRTQKNTGRC
jgi:hypothetical protein